MDLIVVESPTKAKTLSRFLEGKFAVEATYGHVRDLPEKRLGIEIDKEFKPEYVQTSKQKERVNKIKQAAESAGRIFLATDPDREGEAISWHMASLLNKEESKRARRIVFHEITRQAVEDAVNNPREIDNPLVDAQQARRILDRLVGYKLSPLLWKKVRKGLSAGRVQSVAVRLIVEREREIAAFKPEEYWVINVLLQTTKGQFTSLLSEKNGQKFQAGNQAEAEEVIGALKQAKYIIESVEKKPFKRTPPAPFTTSTLQQAAANRLGWSAKKTMQVAQALYEQGDITYHRTDSTNLAAEAVAAAREYIENQYGKNYALRLPRFYKTKSKVAQEAHEAIRPTVINRTRLTEANREQERLYEMIWKRFTACQMAEASGETMIVKTAGRVGEDKYGFIAKGQTINFEGWLKLYGSKQDAEEEEESKQLPPVTEGDAALCLTILNEQKFTQPPARYNDAGLIKTLEEMGIGRPSTYAPTLSTIQDRQYVEKMDRRFKPTVLGIAVNDFLVSNFGTIVDYKFTARMEDELDDIANGLRRWQPVMADFYKPFAQILDQVAQSAQRVKIEVETTGEKCPKCQEGEVVIRVGKFGKFLACSRFPQCDWRGNWQNKVGVPCPKCQGEVIARKTRSGKTFFGCSNYPNCDFASWTKPAGKPANSEAEGKSENTNNQISG